LKKKISHHPYTVTTILFLAFFLAGLFYLRMDRHELGFLLLVYLLVTMGIRLDDISKRLASVEVAVNQLLRSGRHDRRTTADLEAPPANGDCAASGKKSGVLPAASSGKGEIAE